MTPREAHAAFSFDSFSRRSLGDKIRYPDNDIATRGRKLKGRIFSSIALIINVYMNENYLCSNEKLLHIDSVNKAYEFLRNTFFSSENAISSNTSSYELDQFQLDFEDSQKSFECKSTSWYSSFLTKYLQDYQRLNENSLCKKMMKITTTRPQIFFVGQSSNVHQRAFLNHHEQQLVNIANVLIKLKKYLKQRYQRSSYDAKFHNPTKHSRTSPRTKDQSTNYSSSTATPKHCDKGIQCSKSTEFLKVSPDIKFFSRSSLVINVDAANNKETSNDDRQHRKYQNNHTSSSPSLEYVANYRPEYSYQSNDDVSNLRSFSSSAIFGLNGSNTKTRCSTEFLKNNSSGKYSWAASYRKSKSKRGGPSSARLREKIKRTEDEILKYTNFIEDDLSSFHSSKTTSTSAKKSKSRNLVKDDILAVKKILLEDYITEVKEIIRSTESQTIDEESRMLESVKRRMDEDLTDRRDSSSRVESARTDSWHSLMPCSEHRLSSSKSKTSYVTACDSHPRNLWNVGHCCCFCRCTESEERFHKNESRNYFGVERGDSRCVLKECENERNCPAPPWICKSCNIKSNARFKDGADTLIKCVACLENTARCKSRIKENQASTAKSSNSVDSGVLVDLPLIARYVERRSTETTNVNGAEDGSEELLCQRVESAVRKFTEELILCERRARDRSRSKRKRKRTSFPRRERCSSQTSTTDQSTCSTTNCPRNTCCSSEDEHITGISTPSLVSLSDSEVFPSPYPSNINLT